MFALIEPSTKRAFTSLFNQEVVAWPDWEHGETRPLEFGLIDPITNPTGARQWEPRDLTGWSMRAALGKGFLLPVAGDFTVTFGANTTAAIPFDATAAEIQDALNLLASIIAAGSVIVTGTNGFFEIAFGNVGARATLVGDPGNLAPLSVTDFGELLPGDASHKEVQVLRIVQNPGAFKALTISSDPAAAGVWLVQAGGAGLNAKYRLSLITRNSGSLRAGGQYLIVSYVAGDDFVNVGGTNVTGSTFTATASTPTAWANGSAVQRVNARQPFDGQFSITVAGLESAMLDFDASEAEVVAALEGLAVSSGVVVTGRKYTIVSFEAGDDFTNIGALSNAAGVSFVASGTTPTTWTHGSSLTPVGVGNVGVQREAQGQYLFVFQGVLANTAMGTITADGSALRVIQTLSGDLSLAKAALDLILGDDESTSIKFELEGTPPGGNLQKLFRNAGTLVDSIIDPSNTEPADVVNYTPSTVAGKYRFKADGTFQLWNADQALFQSLTITGAAGAEIVNIGAGEP